jgi:tRNA-dihydrouridine synthase B
VLDATGADGVMIGRAAQGRPWIFREIEHFLATGEELPPPLVDEIHQVLRGHLADLYAFYGRKPACASRASTSPGTPRGWRDRRSSATP